MNKFCLGKFSSGSLLQKRLEQVPLLLFLLMFFYSKNDVNKFCLVLYGLDKFCLVLYFRNDLDKFCLVLYSRNDLNWQVLSAGSLLQKRLWQVLSVFLPHVVFCSTGIGSKFCLVSYPHLKAQSSGWAWFLTLRKLTGLVFYSLMRDVLSGFIVYLTKLAVLSGAKGLSLITPQSLTQWSFVWLPTHSNNPQTALKFCLVSVLLGRNDLKCCLT